MRAPAIVGALRVANMWQGSTTATLQMSIWSSGRYGIQPEGSFQDINDFKKN